MSTLLFAFRSGTDRKTDSKNNVEIVLMQFTSLFAEISIWGQTEAIQSIFTFKHAQHTHAQKIGR